jgi:hypothetical protein
MLSILVAASEHAAARCGGPAADIVDEDVHAAEMLQYFTDHLVHGERAVLEGSLRERPVQRRPADDRPGSEVRKYGVTRLAIEAMVREAARAAARKES